MQTKDIVYLNSNVKKELADHIIRLIRIIPSLEIPSYMSDIINNPIGAQITQQYNMQKQSLYLKAYDIAFYLASQYEGDQIQMVVAATDIVEIVKDKLEATR